GSSGTGSVSIVTLNPVNVITITTGFSIPMDIIYDGSNIWVIDHGDQKLKKLDSSGNILQSIFVGPSTPSGSLAFDGANIWVPVISTLVVVRATGTLSGMTLATLSGNGLNNSRAAAFDGERILVTNFPGDSVSLWKASDFTPSGNIPTGTGTAP